MAASQSPGRGSAGAGPLSPSLSPRRAPLPPLAELGDDMKPTEGGASLLKTWAQFQTKPAALGEAPLDLQVLDIYRYMVDSAFWTVTGLPPQGAWAFDMVLSDGVDKIKVVLDPALNKLVFSGELAKLNIIRILDAERRFDDTKNKVPSFELLLGLEVVSRLNEPFQRNDERKPSYPMRTPNHVRTRAPMISSRGVYLPPFATDTPLAYHKRGNIPSRISLAMKLPENDDSGIPDDHPSLSELIAHRIGKRPRGAGANNVPYQEPPERSDGPPILGRIATKRGWGWYGKPTDLKERFPCRFTLVLQDASYTGLEEVQVTVWNALSPDLFHALQVGDLIWIQDYKARNTKIGLEIMVNSGRYGATVNIVHPEQHMKSWPKHFLEARLPLPPLRLIGNSHLNLVPDYTEVELAGLVLHVSAMEVERNPGMEREYRWCIVRDSEGTVLVKIYTAGGIAAVKQRIVPGSHLFATDLAVISSPAVSGSLKERRVYLQATLSTQVWVFDPEHTEGLWFAETAAGQFIDPGDRPTDYTVAGSIDPIQPFSSLTDLIRARPRMPEITPLIELDGILSSLSLHERKRVWVVCRVSSISLPAAKTAKTVRISLRDETYETALRLPKRKQPEPELEPENQGGPVDEVVPETPPKPAKRAKRAKAERQSGILGYLTNLLGGNTAVPEEEKEEEEGVEVDGAVDVDSETRPSEEPAAGPSEPREPSPPKRSLRSKPNPGQDAVVGMNDDGPEGGSPRVRRRIESAGQPVAYPAPHPDPKIIGAFLDSPTVLVRSFAQSVEAPEPMEEARSAEQREEDLAAECVDVAADPDRIDPIEELFKEAPAPEKDWVPGCLELDPVNPAPIRVRALVIPNCGLPGVETDLLRTINNVPDFVRRTFVSQLAPCLTDGMKSAVTAFKDEEAAKLMRGRWTGRTFLLSINLHRDGWKDSDVKCVVSEGYILPEEEDEEETKLLVKDGKDTFVVSAEGEEIIGEDEE